MIWQIGTPSDSFGIFITLPPCIKQTDSGGGEKIGYRELALPRYCLAQDVLYALVNSNSTVISYSSGFYKIMIPTSGNFNK